MADSLVTRLPRAFRRRGASIRVQQAGGALVLAALGGAIAYLAMTRRAATAAADPTQPEAPVIVWEG